MKKSIKLIIILVVGIFLGGFLTITYANTYSSSEITYDNSTSGSTKTNVKDAVDELYNIANKRVNIRVASNKRCIRALNLHSDGTHTFGNLGTSGTLNSGDAFDCDVNNDGTYDGTTERFYYVTDLASNTNKAVLIYYSNTSAGVATPSKKIAYNSSNVNNAGPVRAKDDLPSTSQWVTTITNPRQITNENGGTTTSAGNIVSYNYGDKAARFLTTQEVSTACGKTVSEMNNQYGLPETCQYLVENTQRFDSSAAYGYWLENPYSSYSNRVWGVRANQYSRLVDYYDANSTGDCGVRPAIEVLKSDIAY